jgi:hypothetical protein
MLKREAWLDKDAKKGFERVRNAGRMRNLFAHVHKGQGSAGKFHFFHPNGTDMIDPKN